MPPATAPRAAGRLSPSGPGVPQPPASAVTAQEATQPARPGCAALLTRLTARVGQLAARGGLGLCRGRTSGALRIGPGSAANLPHGRHLVTGTRAQRGSRPGGTPQTATAPRAAAPARSAGTQRPGRRPAAGSGPLLRYHAGGSGPPRAAADAGCPARDSGGAQRHGRR
ncbi:hypothetical protein O3W51_47545, partial [Streptomyces sp. H39-C1]|nr:hypothetical protein [Streptomyces sp. H39-C1]